MSIISRLTTWTIGQVLKAADLNGEFSNITNLLNNLDAATTTWTNVKATTGTITSATITTAAITSGSITTITNSPAFSPTTAGLKGTTTNDSTSAGNVGEYTESVVASVAMGAAAVISDLTSISLTAGDWDVSAAVYFSGGTGYTVWQLGISTTSGNSTTGMVLGSNRFLNDLTSGVSLEQCLFVPVYRMSLASTTTVYMKVSNSYTGGSPVGSGRLSARRMR